MLMKQCVHVITGIYEVLRHPVKLHIVKLLVKPSARIRMLEMEVRTHSDLGLLISISILHIDRSFPRTTDACETNVLHVIASLFPVSYGGMLKN